MERQDCANSDLEISRQGAGLSMSISALQVRDWDHFKLLKAALLEQAGFQPHARMVQRITYPSNPTVGPQTIRMDGSKTREA
jgi:hypothetical protein